MGKYCPSKILLLKLLPRHDEDLREPLVRRQGSQVSMRVARGSACWLLKLKLQYFGHLMQRVESLEKTLMLGGIGGRRRRG